MVSIADAEHRWVSSVLGFGIVFEDESKEHIIDAKPQLVSLEKREDLMNRQAICDVRLASTYELQDRLAIHDIASFLRPHQRLPVFLDNGVYPTFVGFV
jgi:hypothetical protein